MYSFDDPYDAYVKEHWQGIKWAILGVFPESTFEKGDDCLKKRGNNEYWLHFLFCNAEMKRKKISPRDIRIRASSDEEITRLLNRTLAVIQFLEKYTLSDEEFPKEWQVKLPPRQSYINFPGVGNIILTPEIWNGDNLDLAVNTSISINPQAMARQMYHLRSQRLQAQRREQERRAAQGLAQVGDDDIILSAPAQRIMARRNRDEVFNSRTLNVISSAPARTRPPRRVAEEETPLPAAPSTTLPAAPSTTLPAAPLTTLPAAPSTHRRFATVPPTTLPAEASDRRALALILRLRKGERSDAEDVVRNDGAGRTAMALLRAQQDRERATKEGKEETAERRCAVM